MVRRLRSHARDCLSEFNLNLVQPVVADIQLAEALEEQGFDRLQAAVVFACGAGWSQPALSSDSHEYVPSLKLTGLLALTVIRLIQDYGNTAELISVSNPQASIRS
jgi:hypothetical protein